MKFRAWNNNQKQFEPHYCFCVLGDGSVCYIENGELEPQKELVITESIGVFDSLGKEIFTGDIIKDVDGELGVVEQFSYLTYDSGGASHPGYYCKEWMDDSDLRYGKSFLKVTVIGNIFENTELIKK